VIIGAIMGQSFQFMAYAFFDEFMLWSILVGAFARIVIQGCAISPESKESERRAVFYMWLAFMILVSFVGIFRNDDMRIVRWVVFYVSFGLLAFITYNYSHVFQPPAFKSIIRIIVITSLIYNVFYMAYGLAWDIILDSPTGHFASQFVQYSLVWSGSAIAAYPTLLGVPASLIIMNEKNEWYEKMAGWVVLMLTMIQGHYYDSRMTWVVLLGCVGVSIRIFKLRYLALMVLIFVVIFSVYGRQQNLELKDRSKDFFGNLLEGVSTLFVSGDKGDVNRRLQFHAAIMRLTENPVTFFVGDGMYSHRTTIIPAVEELFAHYLDNKERKKPAGWDDARPGEWHTDNTGSFDLFRTTGFSGLIVDAGVVGMMLFLANYIYVALLLLRQRSRYRVMLLYVLIISYCWLFVNDVKDVTILYLLIMPGGILEQLSGKAKVESSECPVLSPRVTQCASGETA
jgi:hypothetical protein